MNSERHLPFGEALQTVRKKRNISQQALARQLRVHRNTIGAWERGDRLPERGTILELARQLRLTDEEIRVLLESSFTALSSYWHLPLLRNPFFTGREEVLVQLHTALFKNHTIALSQFYTLSGLGGIGKTQTAIEYAYRYANDHTATFWLSAETKDTILSDFASIAEQLQLPECAEKEDQKIVQAVQHWLATHKGWLLIFDNVEAVSILKPFLPSARQGAILITTRLHTLDGLATILDLAPLSVEDAIVLLLRRARLVEQTCSIEQIPATLLEPARILVTLMDGLPLAIDQAGAYIESTGCSLASYLHLYQSHQDILLSERSDTAEHPHSVVQTFILSFEKLAQVNAAAADLLRICAFLAPDAIPEDLFTLGSAYLGPDLGPVASDPYQFNQCIGIALSYSLLRRNPQNETFSLHRLVQVVLKSAMDAAASHHWLARAIQILVFCGSLIPQHQIWSRYGRYFLHAQHAVSLIDEGQAVSVEAIQLYYLIGRYFEEHTHYREAEDIYQQAVSLGEQVLEPDHPSFVSLLNGLGDLYREQGRYDLAEPLLVRCLFILRQTLGPDHLDVSHLLVNLGTLYREQGYYDRAEPLLLHCLSIREQALGPDHSQVAHALSNLGTLYNVQGYYDKAEPILLRSVHVCEQALGSDHPFLAYALNNLGVLYMDQGRYNMAEPVVLQSLHIWEKALGPNNSLLAHAFSNLGALYIAQGDCDRAEPLLLQCLQIWKDVFDADHPLLAEAFHNLGTLRREQGQYQEAMSYYQQALQIREKNFGIQHLEMAQTLYDVGLLSHRRGLLNEAEHFLRQALNIQTLKLGVDHPKTKITQTAYAHLLYVLEREDELKPFAQR